MEKRNPAREKYIVEAVLFASGEPAKLKDVAKAVGLGVQETEALILQLMEEYSEEKRGMQILRLEDRFQMCTNPLYYPNIEVLYRQKAEIRLTDTQLETLAIITYRQPITRQEINDIRGVSSDAVVSRLMEMGLVEEAGRLKAPGRPLLLKTSDEFLRTFQIASVEDLPHPVDTEHPEDEVEQLELSD